MGRRCGWEQSVARFRKCGGGGKQDRQTLWVFTYRYNSLYSLYGYYSNELWDSVEKSRVGAQEKHPKLTARRVGQKSKPANLGFTRDAAPPPHPRAISAVVCSSGAHGRQKNSMSPCRTPSKYLARSCDACGYSGPISSRQLAVRSPRHASTRAACWPLGVVH